MLASQVRTPWSDGGDHLDGPQRPICGLEGVEDLLFQARGERLALVEESGDRGAAFDDRVVRAEESLGIESPERRAALAVVGRIPVGGCKRGVAGRVRHGACHHRVGHDRRVRAFVDDGEVASRVTRRVEDGQAPVTEVELRGRDDHVCHRAAVVVGPHPVAELRVRVDLVGVPELAIAVVDQPVDRVHERPVERMAHGERPRRKPACGGQASRVVDVGVRDEDVSTRRPRERRAPLRGPDPESPRRPCR